MTEQAQNQNSADGGRSRSTELLERFEAWWQAYGQFCRAGGGDYEKTFAYLAWEAAEEAERDRVVVTTTRTGECVLVSRQDEEGRILSVIWESDGPYGAHTDLRSNASVRGERSESRST